MRTVSKASLNRLSSVNHSNGRESGTTNIKASELQNYLSSMEVQEVPKEVLSSVGNINV